MSSASTSSSTCRTASGSTRTFTARVRGVACIRFVSLTAVEIDDDDEELVDGPTSVKSRPDSQQTPPALPKKEPPQNSEILATTPETTPSKGAL